MGNSKGKAAAVADAAEVAVKTEVVRAPERSIYSAEELADNHKIFKTSREIVVVALRLARKEAATLEEATRIIDKFKNKEVK